MSTASQIVDAVVVGGGHNGLVAAIDLADAGWDVVVLEAADAAGGAVRSAETTAPGFCTDLFSAFYPVTASPENAEAPGGLPNMLEEVSGWLGRRS